MAEGLRWGIDSGVRGSNAKDQDFWGKRVRSDENSIVKFKDGTKRDRYEKNRTARNRSRTEEPRSYPLLIHDYDYQNSKNNIEQFYLNLKT